MSRRLLRLCAWIPAFLLTTSLATAEVRLPALFSDHMVLQAGQADAVWGWASPGEKICVSIAGQTKSATAGTDGRWQLRLDPLRAGGPHVLKVQSTNTIRVRDVLVGEVWLGSGQSNMAMKVANAQDFAQEQAAANLPTLRMFNVERLPITTPQADCKGQWQVCTPETVGAFSATAYFFGRPLLNELQVPVGLINSSVGGTDIAAWTSAEVQQKVPALLAQMESWKQRDTTFDMAQAKADHERRMAAWKEAAKKARAAKRDVPRAPKPPVEPQHDQNRPANLYNGMIAPLIPYTIRGAIWYQGEHNSRTPETGALYSLQLPLLIADWRARWGYDFPFAWVQLPNFNRTGGGWEVVRESMLKSLSVKDTGMAITIDIGDPKDIHPKNKQEVGRRLAMWALAKVYGKPGASSGPLPASHEIRGQEVCVRFQHADGGLVAKGGELRGFVIAGADRQWVPAQARIDGQSVIVSSPQVKQPVAVRYAWSDNPDCNLYNGAGLPATPFRTDEGQP